MDFTEDEIDNEFGEENRDEWGLGRLKKDWSALAEQIRLYVINS